MSKTDLLGVLRICLSDSVPAGPRDGKSANCSLVTFDHLLCKEIRGKQRLEATARKQPHHILQRRSIKLEHFTWRRLQLLSYGRLELVPFYKRAVSGSSHHPTHLLL